MTSRRLPPTSTTIRSRPASASSPAPDPPAPPAAARQPAAPDPPVRPDASSPAYGGSLPLNSVSIHRVCTVNGSLVNAGSSSSARWNGSTVGIPPISNSARARRARSSACGRSAPVTISLAISESNICGTVIPAA